MVMGILFAVFMVLAIILGISAFVMQKKIDENISNKAQMEGGALMTERIELTARP